MQVTNTSSKLSERQKTEFFFFAWVNRLEDAAFDDATLRLVAARVFLEQRECSLTPSEWSRADTYRNIWLRDKVVRRTMLDKCVTAATASAGRALESRSRKEATHAGASPA